MKYHLPEARIIGQQKTGPGLYLLDIAAPEIAAAAEPGQFVHIRVTGQLDPLLRRPLSICGADRSSGVIRLWYQVVGRGTQLLCERGAGEALDVIGPLGRGFAVGQQNKNACLIGGGMGIAPLLFLGGELTRHNKVTAFFGGRNGEFLPRQDFLPEIDCRMATEDGTSGEKGLVTELLTQWLAGETPDIIYACGPNGMLKEVARLASQHNIALQVSLEATMACGVGACLGCICGKSKEAPEAWLKACQDGPVFWAEEVEL